MSKKLLAFDVEVTYKRMINAANSVELRNIGKYLYEGAKLARNK